MEKAEYHGAETYTDVKQSYIYNELCRANEKFGGSVSLCWEQVEKLLRHIPGTHPFHTSHGPDHALALMQILDNAIRKAGLQLNEQELYILILATLVHDVGMVGTVGVDDYTSRTYRNRHHIRTRQYVLNNWKTLYIKKDYRKAVASVAAAHRRLDIKSTIVERKIGINELEAPRLQLCAALLRLADECHITQDRIPEDYGILELPVESLKHFCVHFNSNGVGFDADEGRVVFSVEVNDNDSDIFLKAAQEKIQNELENLQEIFSKYGISYKQVVFDADRENFIKYKVGQELLKEGSIEIDELVTRLMQTEEKEEDVKLFVKVNGEAEPYNISGDSGDQGKITFCCNERVFLGLAEEFLFSPKSNRDPILFVKSCIAKEVLTDEYIEKIVGKSISINAPRPTIFRTIRVSPSCLKYVLRNKDDLPTKAITGSSGFFDSLRGELQNDFLAYPELLLEPGLLDEVFKRGSERWNSLKVEQIAKYHQAFDLQKLAEQWLGLNEWEQRIRPKFGGEKTISGQFKLQEKLQAKQVRNNAIEVMVSSYRIGLPLQLEASDSLKLEFKIEDKELSEEGQHEATMMKIDHKPAQMLRNTLLPGRIINKEGSYALEILVDKVEFEDISADYPLLVKLAFVQRDKKDNANYAEVSGSIGVDLNYYLLDCFQASQMIKAQEAKSVKVYIKKEKGEAYALTIEEPFEKLLRGFWSLEKDLLIEKLGVIQHFAGKRIPFPVFGLPAGLEDKLAEITVETEKESLEAWETILREVSKKPKEYVSSFSVEIIEANKVVMQRYLGETRGIRYPKIGEQQEDAGPETEMGIMQNKIADATCNYQIPYGNFTLSPSALTEFLRNNIRNNVPDLVVMQKFQAKSIEEQNTRVTWCWLSEKDRLWQMITPFVVRLEKLTWERWLLEASYLERDKKDLKRAYVAAGEAYAIAPSEIKVGIYYGWIAFQLGRVSEAMKFTCKGCQNGEPLDDVIRSVNLGLYHLVKVGSKECENRIADAKKWYGLAIKKLNELTQTDRGIAIQAAIEDIEVYRNKLSDKADGFLEAFRKLDSGDFTVQDALKFLEEKI